MLIAAHHFKRAPFLYLDKCVSFFSAQWHLIYSLNKNLHTIYSYYWQRNASNPVMNDMAMLNYIHSNISSYRSVVFCFLHFPVFTCKGSSLRRKFLLNCHRENYVHVIDSHFEWQQSNKNNKLVVNLHEKKKKIKHDIHDTICVSISKELWHIKSDFWTRFSCEFHSKFIIGMVFLFFLGFLYLWKRTASSISYII